MHTIIRPPSPARSPRTPEAKTTESFRQPNYDCRDHPDAVKLAVYVPGVEAAGVDIEARGPDLMITARKSRFVRVNWQSLHLEGAQRDYQLRLRLGESFDYPAMQAEIHDGVLTVTLPKRASLEMPATLRRVA
jgi:HSP20 family molecular chaperone IbpA